MRDSWDRRIERCEALAARPDPTASLLVFYARVLRIQKDLYEFLRNRRGWQPSGSLDRDLEVVRTRVPELLRAVAENGPEPLALDARALLEGGGAAVDTMLVACWRAPSDRHFFAKVVLQPYAQWLADSGISPVDRALTRADNRCPFCGGHPQLSVLHAAADADGGGRLLLCATCLTTWPFRRVLCACCGEENERQLGYFHSQTFDHLRIDACETCKRYLKSVDLTKLGLAVPIVDEIAGAPLDLWAREHGYEKIELNLVGL